MRGRWIREAKNGCAVVFLHGVLSSGDICWKHSNGTFWPDLLASEDNLQNFGVYEFTYKTGLFSGQFSLGDVVDSLKEFMRLDGVSDCDEIAFVCHSMGGIVARRYIVQRATELKAKDTKLALFLLASPSLGSDYANWLSPLARFFGHTQADVLRFSENNTWLMDLDRDFQNLKEANQLNLVGKELVEDNFIVLKSFWRKQVVRPFAGAKYFGEPYKVPNSDHFSIAKVKSPDEIQHRLLIQFLSEFTSEPKKQHKEMQVSGGAVVTPTSNAKPVQKSLKRDHFAASVSTINKGNALLCTMYLDQEQLSFNEVLNHLHSDIEFVDFFQSLFLQSGFEGYVWEFPPLTASVLDHPFEFVIHRSPSASAVADKDTFAEYFEHAENLDDVLVFNNLGGDALLIVPCPYRDGIDYSGTLQFLKNSPKKQQWTLWSRVAAKTKEIIDNDETVWVSVASGGVLWLHVRLDSFPKYYRHQPYTSIEYTTQTVDGSAQLLSNKERPNQLNQEIKAGDGSTIIQVGRDYKS